MMSCESLYAESQCYGTTSKGKIEKSVKLPLRGKNYEVYSTMLWGIGRTYVHSKVRDIWIKALEKIQKEQPSYTYQYAETGFKDGGQFSPHKTHQNGLSVDVLVPVRDIKNKKQQKLPTNLRNKFGYDIDFNTSAQFKHLEIDFDALGLLIKTLVETAQKNNIKVWRVIFDPRLQPLLYQSKHGSWLQKNVLIPKKKSWVRHDDHIHIDFNVKCQPFH